MFNKMWQNRQIEELKDEIIVLVPKKKNSSTNYSIIVVSILFVLLLSKYKHSSKEPGNVAEQVQANGYIYEVHNVTTMDGYVLEIERIHKKTYIAGNKKVVLLTHGMSQVAAAWLCKGPHKSLGYNLADDDYDVWLLNVRGNSVSKYHTADSSTSKKYWSHTFHEMGIYDLPSTIDYIMQSTKVQQIDYVGFSMGSTIYYVLLSEYPNYANKFRRVVSLAPAVYGTDIPSTYPPIYYYLAAFQKVANYTKTFLHYAIPGYICEQGDFTWYLNCVLINGIRLELYDKNINQEELHKLLLNSTGTFSSGIIHHYYQSFATDQFRKFNYGNEDNVKIYGRESPPKYNLLNVKPPMAIIYSEGDQTCTPRGVEKLITELPNIKYVHKIEIEGFSHGSFHLADSAKEEIYDRVIEFFGRDKV